MWSRCGCFRFQVMVIVVGSEGGAWLISDRTAPDLLDNQDEIHGKS